MKSKILGLLVLGLLAGPVASNAGVVDFEDIAVANGVNSIGGDRVSGGFAFDSSTDHTHLMNNAFSSNSGSTYLVTDDFYGAATTTMSQVGGGVFSLSSIQLGEVISTTDSASDITVTGNLFGGGTIQTMFTLDGLFSVGGSNNFQTFLFGGGWSNLTSAVFDATSGQGAFYWAMDNIGVGVPEPGTLALLGLGLLGLGVTRRKAA